MTLETIHACPTSGQAVTSCCGRTPFELPRMDRMSTDASLVNCRTEAEEQFPVGEYRLSTR
ncbi:hypothetical protein ABT119_05735 [Streptomyces sp. NPDC001910]|uniref:hypothetical protein n=1 Tax=Streptomyces sp. NPDC001910 TaxID=3154403 RepID=UPI0033182EE3